uniref:Uncharacterized protein n=1 Tax=Craspedostauros australis TaxID=1486917 RepID=A0A7R9X029_9STRA|mmetsp:Transcript_3419/g.9054  ORF Transcript_3419/g.9054 Transcript_3419/m.9054 type:complete len:176 (+) Transcript_3419:104-631(+)
MFIKATYTIANDTGEPQTHQFQLDASNVEIQPVGLPDNTPATKVNSGSVIAAIGVAAVSNSNSICRVWMLSVALVCCCVHPTVLRCSLPCFARIHFIPFLSQPQAGEYKYSGVHDHGDLIPPIEDANDMKALISCMGTFKKESDQLLTKLIEDEKLKKTTASAEENPMKRPRVDQ